MVENRVDNERRLRRGLPFAGEDGKGVTSLEVMRKILHSGPGGESRRIDGAIFPVQKISNRQYGPLPAARNSQKIINNQIDRDILAAGRRGRR